MSEFDFLTAGEIETLAFASAKKEAAEARADVIEPVQTELQKGDAAEFPVPIQPEQAKEAGIPDQSTVQEHRVPVFTQEEQEKEKLRAEFEAAPVLDSFDKHGRIDLHNPITTKLSTYKGVVICNAIVKGDYSFILNPKLREKIENIGRVSSDPERHRKSLALAAYIFNMGLNNGQTVGYVFDHIDEYIQPGGFFGNSGTVDGAYDHIRNVMTLKPLDNDVTDPFKDKFWTKPVRETKFAVWTSAMAENVAAGVFEVPAFFIGGNMKYNPICLGLGYLYELGTPGATQMQENMGMNFAARQAARSREIEDWITTPARFYHEEGAAAVQILQQELGYDPDFINKAWSGEMGWGDFFANAGMQFGIIAPKLYVDLTLGVFTGGASIFATSAAQAKYAYLRENPQASEYEADSYGALMGAIELGTEAITLKMGKGWLGKLSGTNKDLMCTSFGAALARTAKNWGEEALSEEAATFLGNVVDGLYGQWDSEKSFTQNLFSDFGAGTIYSLPTSLVFSAPDYINIKHNQKLANLHAQTQQMIQTLENQETLSETENVLLKQLKMIEDSGDYEALGKVLDMAKTEQYLREQREAAADAAPANTTTITGEDGSQAVQQTQFAEDATAEVLQTAAAEVQRLQLKQMMPHNPEDTEQAVLQEAGTYGVPIQTTRAWTDEQVQILIERAGIPQDIAPGDRQKFIDRIKMKWEAIWNPDGTITINTAVVRPSRVPFVVAHELLVHEGLARVFNPSAKKELMDTIWKDFGETDLMKSIVRRYGLRRSRTDEVRQVYQEEMTDPERREAAEEFLAHLGETNGVPLETIYTQNQDEIDAWARSKKLQGSREHLTREWMYETGYRPERPGWLRQLISAIRVWLRQHGFTKLVSTLSDQDIQYILAKAAKADLSKRRARNGEAARLALFDDQDKSEQIIDALIKIANGEEEVTLSNIRNDLEDYGGTNDITLIYGNEKKGLYHIAYRRGINVLFHVLDAMASGQVTKHVAGNQTLHIEKDGFEAILALTEFGNQKSWLLSGWEIGKPDAFSEVGTQSKATQSKPTFSRQELGAGLQNIISQNSQNFKPQNENSSRNSVSPEADVTETAPFKNWFGDSKVVDESGKPLEVYHGTNWDGWEFDTENGAFFSEKEDYAEEMAAQRGGSRIVKAYLSIRNPLVVKVPGNKMADPEFEARIIAEAKSKGHDGVKLETDTNNEIEKDVFWVAFEQNQIKSATDNVGTFDPGNNDVRFSVAPDEELEQTGEAIRFIYEGDKAIPIAEGFQFDKTKDMQEAMKEYILALRDSGKHFVIREDQVDVRFNQDSGDEFSNSSYTQKLRNYKSKLFKAKAKCVAAIGSIIENARNGRKENATEGHSQAAKNKKFRRYDVEFALPSGEKDVKVYTGELVVLLGKEGKTGTFYDITNIKYDRKAGNPLIRETPTGALPEEEGQLRTHLPVGSNLPSSAENASGGTGKTSEKINGGTDEYGDGVRFLLINLDLTEDERSLVNIMKALVSGQFNPDFDYAQRVKDVYGLEVSAEDAKFAAMVALREKKADAQRAAREKAYAYFRSNNPLFEFIDDFAGGFHDFHIVPVNGKGEKFTGTFIAPEYVRWSEKRPQGKNESDKRYQKYLHDREEALKKAKGYDSADLAEAYARKTGLDTVTVEQEIVELFRDLKKPDILSAWKKYKDENLGMSRQEQEMLKKSQEDYFRNMAEDAAMEVLEAGQPVITEDWIKQNRDVFEVLYEQLTGKKEAPYKLSKSDMESLNAAIVQDHGAGSVYFAARKEAREASRQEFEKRLAEFRQAVQAREVNTMNLQRELVDFIRKNLPGDLHGKYEKRIISLMKLKTDYKREEVFQNILSDMLEDSLNSKRHDLIKRITDMLERNKTKRTDKNVPYSPMGDRQQVLDRIFKIVRMSEGTVALSCGVHAERLEAIEKTLEGYSDDQDRAEEQIKLQQEKKEIERDLFYLEHYGNLSHKEIEEIDNSMKMLEKFIRKGRDEFKSRLDERAQRTRVLRESLRMEMSRGSLSVPHKDSLDIRENKLYRYALNNLSLSQQVRMFSRQEDDLKFHDSTHGKILAMIEDSTQKEATFIRKGQQRLDEVYKKLGIKNKIVLGKFLSSLEQEQDTGIDIPMYVTVKKSARDPKITYTSEAAGRQKLTGSFNVEHIRHLNELLEEGLQITSILRTGSLENYRAIAEEIRSDLGVPLEGGFTVCLEHDGSFRILTGNGSGGITDHHFGRHQMTATMQQRMAEEDALFPIDQYARASIRARVEEYDAGMDTSYKPDTGDDIDNAALAAAEKSERGDRVKAPHVMLLAANPQNMVEGKKRLKISPAAAVQLLLEWEQDNYKLNFDFYGFTEEKIAALKSWLEINHSGALKLGYALRDLVFEQRGELDAAVFEKYGVHLPETKNFWYGDFSSNMADQIRDAGYGNPVGGLTVSANFLTGRKFHLQKPGTKTSFMNLFMMRQLETAHFIAYSQTIRDIRAIYNSSEVQNIMIREFGIDALSEWRKGLEQLASGGEISNFKTLQALANYIHEIFYPANVALNLKSVCSQIAGGTAYALYVPPAQLIKRLPFNRNDKKYRDFLETVMKSDYFLNRMNGSGFDPYMNTFLNPYSKKKVTPIKDSIIQKSMALTLWGDKVSSTTFGYAAYSYFYDQAIKNGKTVAEAKQYALQMWERATDETQQSGYTKDRNKFNTNPGILRALTAYMTSPMQQFGLELSSILRACKDPTKKNLTEAGRRILINHFVSTTIFNLIASAFRHGFNFGDYLEDWEDYVRGWILGQMDSLFLVGTVLTETFNLLTGNGLFHDEKSLLPMKENFVRDYRKIKSDITGRSEVDWLDYLQASGDVMMSAGPAPSRLFGGALYITSREIRRARRWFEGDEDKERKKKKAAR